MFRQASCALTPAPTVSESDVVAEICFTFSLYLDKDMFLYAASPLSASSSFSPPATRKRPKSPESCSPALWNSLLGQVPSGLYQASYFVCVIDYFTTISPSCLHWRLLGINLHSSAASYTPLLPLLRLLLRCHKYHLLYTHIQKHPVSEYADRWMPSPRDVVRWAHCTLATLTPTAWGSV